MVQAQFYQPKGASALSDGARKAASVRNGILAGLSRKEYARIRPSLEHVTLKSGQVLYEPGAVMQWAYFLETAVVSVLSQIENGMSIEVSVLGHEGMIGMPIILGSQGLPYKTLVQSSGTEDEGRRAPKGILSV